MITFNKLVRIANSTDCSTPLDRAYVPLESHINDCMHTGAWQLLEPGCSECDS